MFEEQIELESESQLNLWLDEFSKQENRDRITLPGIPYSEPAITRELIRREFLEDITASWNDTH